MSAGDDIYRRIKVRMWSDEKFLGLSKPQPNGRDLFIFLLCGPFTLPVPGLMRTTEGGMADELEWPIEGFREAFAEVQAKGMVKADWKHRVVWVPNAIFHNAPQSPNVVTSWKHGWAIVPECDLKNEAYRDLLTFLEGKSKAFAKAFRDACPIPSANQEQDQEQEEEYARAHACEDNQVLAVHGLGVTVVAEAWHASANAAGRVPLHAPAQWRREYATIAAGIVAEARGAGVDPSAVLWGLMAWFWLGPDGPVQAKRIRNATPAKLAKLVSTDLERAGEWSETDAGREAVAGCMACVPIQGAGAFA